jgi:hypothetical protein
MKGLENNIEGISYIGCCCFNCKTCKEFTIGNCKGCKLGYIDGKRDINKAKCKTKLCCFKERKFNTCADCTDYSSCSLIQNRFKGYQLKKSLGFIEFMKENGYKKYIKYANKWNNYYGVID